MEGVDWLWPQLLSLVTRLSESGGKFADFGRDVTIGRCRDSVNGNSCSTVVIIPPTGFARCR